MLHEKLEWGGPRAPRLLALSVGGDRSFVLPSLGKYVSISSQYIEPIKIISTKKTRCGIKNKKKHVYKKCRLLFLFTFEVSLVLQFQSGGFRFQTVHEASAKSPSPLEVAGCPAQTETKKIIAWNPTKTKRRRLLALAWTEEKVARPEARLEVLATLGRTPGPHGFDQTRNSQKCGGR